ncbi:helix-turn-helix domain-containing protein [Aquimarina aquimarini]|uniref:helix-turn-helix domain-containing protein n=1 Tax=Aquimarina aquimarini TaxID=1191734 RepID=UPI001F22067E|nr:AraC family transcriptional regulator [Aquimarina aquimarini]
MKAKRTYKTTSFLSKYIDRFYVVEQSIDNNSGLPPILPGTGLELLFHINIAVSINSQPLEKGHIVCPRTISYFDHINNAAFIAVRFKSGAFRHFTSIPFSELNDTFISVQDIWGDKGRELLCKLEHILAIPSKIKEIEKFLLHAFNTYHQTKNGKWDTVIHDLYYHFNERTIKEVSDKTKIGLRQFERSFKDQFGITPKAFQKITRFQDTTKKILLNKNTSYLHEALENGYYDQSHFIKEFKYFANKTPAKYFSENELDNHFYYKSIK